MKPGRRFPRLSRQRGVSLVELSIALPMFVLLIFIIAELGLMHEAKSVLDVAALAAARSGAIHGGDAGEMKNAAVLALAPLYASETGAAGLAAGWGKAKLDTGLPHAAGATSVVNNPPGASFNGAGGASASGLQVDILSPTRQMVSDFGVMRSHLDGSSETRKEKVIPNDNLSYRDTRLINGVNVQDANLLKIKVIYLYETKMPLTRYFFTPFMNANLTNVLFEGGAAGSTAEAPGGWRVPLVAYATVRMQSDFKLASLEAAASGSDTGSTGTGATGSGTGGEPGSGTGSGSGSRSGSDSDTGSGSGLAEVSGESPPVADGGAGSGEPDGDTGACLSESDGCGCDGGDALTGGMSTAPGISLSGGEISAPIGMMRSAVQSRTASLALSDMPLAYIPTKGPKVPLSFTYSQRESNQPQVFHYSNLGPKWTYTGITYIVDDPAEAGHNVQHYMPGGGMRLFQKRDYDARVRRFAPDIRDQSVLVLVSTAPVKYERRLADGGLDIYAHSDSQSVFPRRIFLTETRDAAGNRLKYQYDNRNRLIAIEDASGGKTVLEYRHGDPLKITALVDPAGNRARIDYDEQGRLIAITDAVGLVSRVSYRGAGGFIETLVTPYGTTKFDTGEAGTARWVEITNPLGHTERVEVRSDAPGISPREPSSPFAISVANRDLHRRNTYYWDAATYARHKGDYTKARIKHWLISDNPTDDVLESLRLPLESRLWYNYPGQKSATTLGTCRRPSAIARVLPDGTTELTRKQYNEWGHLTLHTDPLGRETHYEYAPNGIDLLKIRQKNDEHYDTLAQYTWDERHRPLTRKDAAGQITQYTWNDAGQLTSQTGPLGGKTRYEYDGRGRLTKIRNPLGRMQASYGYDAAGNIVSETDAGGLILKHDYDGLNRRTKTTYPDGTTTGYTWDKLDIVQIKDRNGKQKRFEYDGVQNRVTEQDALRTIRHGYDESGRRTSLADGNGHITRWQYDLQGRLIAKTTPDGAKTAYDYDTAGRQIKRTDALGQERLVTYAKDGGIVRIDYRNAVNPTPGVRFVWDEYYPRINAMSDGTGTTTYTYGHTGAPGALKLKTEDGPGDNDAYSRRYDEAGRLGGWRIGDAGENHWRDALGRVTGSKSPLGIFQYRYLGDTRKLSRAELSGTSIKRNYTHEATEKDDRPKRIAHPADARSYDYANAPENLIKSLTETVRGQRRSWQYDYDALDRLTGADRSDGNRYRYTLDAGDNLTIIAGPGGTRAYAYDAGSKIGGFKYDANGNLIEDDRHTYAWDAENRLIGIGYKAASHRKTEFRYDGKGRRVAAIETNGTNKTETRHGWCGDRICQMRDGADKPVAYYFEEGTYRPENQAREYHVRDHLGSVRDVLDREGKLQASYDYDPYGQFIGQPAKASGFGYAGMYYHAPSGLYLTKYRAYDPRGGRWLSRDPIGEAGGINLYGYAKGNPVGYNDPLGLNPAAGMCVATGPGALVCVAVVGVATLGATYLWVNTNRSSSPLPGERIDGYDTGTGRSVSGMAAEEENCPPDTPTGAGASPIDPADPDALSAGHREAAGNRTDARYGGNCTPDEHDELSRRQDDACGEKQNLPRCKGDLSPDDNVIRQNRMKACRDARNDVMNQCFAGGNQGHRDQIAQILTQIANCDRMIVRYPRP
jgi:RHS repeat-associated protein